MLSVVILTNNEEERIKACLESVRWADEIIIIDSNSSDNTVEIATKYTNKIIKINNNDFSERRNQGMKEAKGDWVLYVDADERVLSALKEEVRSSIVLTEKNAFAISRRNIIFGQEVKYGFYKKDWMIRLFKKSMFETWVGRIHEHARFKGELGYLKNSLLHLTHRDIDQIVLKSLEWSKIDAQLRLDSKHPKMTSLRFIRVLLTEIFNQGLKRGGFFNSTVGTMDAILQVFSLFITYVRLWQMQQSKPLKQIYDEIDEKLIESKFKFQ